MIAQLKEISKNEYYPSVEVEYWESYSKSITVDGEVYSKKWAEPKICNTDDLIINRLSDINWHKIIYDLSWLNHHNIILWDYTAFYDSPLMRKIAYDNRKTTSYLIRMYRDNENIFDNKIISKITHSGYDWRDTRIRDEDIVESILNYNSIPLEIDSAGVYIKIKHFLKLPIYEFPDEYKDQIKRNFIDLNMYRDNVFTLPKSILIRQLDEGEINKILLDFLKTKINLKRKKS